MRIIVFWMCIQDPSVRILVSRLRDHGTPALHFPAMRSIAALALLLLAVAAQAQVPRAVEADFFVKDFHFRSGEVMPEVRIHYATVGTLRRTMHGTNAVLVLHGTGGSLQQFLNDRFAGVLFAPGGALDASKYFVVIPDNVGHGKSSKPSDGLRAKFPHYDYDDMVELQHRLLAEGLGVDHLYLVMGTSMGGMHTWMWGERWPDAMDALVPLASAPAQIAGRNRIWRKMMIDDLQHNDLTAAVQILLLVGSAPLQWQKAAADRDERPRRSPLRHRVVARLRPCAGARSHHRAAAGHQLGGRFHQPAGARHHGERDQTREARTLSAAADHRRHARTRDAHLGSGVGEAVAGISGRDTRRRLAVTSFLQSGP